MWAQLHGGSWAGVPPLGQAGRLAGACGAACAAALLGLLGRYSGDAGHSQCQQAATEGRRQERCLLLSVAGAMLEPFFQHPPLSALLPSSLQGSNIDSKVLDVATSLNMVRLSPRPPLPC